ncbi:MAG TPA: isoprenylcysteine carboxylmethyltransferase family protein [Pyrinomonadaceae bacterium]
MRREELYSILFTAFQLAWAFVWAARHIQARRRRQYAANRAVADTNTRYKIISCSLFFAQNALCIASFWSDAQVLLKIHDSDSMRLVGLLLTSAATVLYFKSLRDLGQNYSPCFDSHVPHEMIYTGPYRFTRHPMYLAKLLVAVGNFVISGSLWFVLMFVYLALETARTIFNEEKYLTTTVPEYAEYKMRTKRMIPFVF